MITFLLHPPVQQQPVPIKSARHLRLRSPPPAGFPQLIRLPRQIRCQTLILQRSIVHKPIKSILLIQLPVTTDIHSVTENLLNPFRIQIIIFLIPKHQPAQTPPHRHLTKRPSPVSGHRRIQNNPRLHLTRSKQHIILHSLRRIRLSKRHSCLPQHHILRHTPQRIKQLLRSTPPRSSRQIPTQQLRLRRIIPGMQRATQILQIPSRQEPENQISIPLLIRYIAPLRRTCPLSVQFFLCRQMHIHQLRTARRFFPRKNRILILHQNATNRAAPHTLTRRLPVISDRIKPLIIPFRTLRRPSHLIHTPHRKSST